MKRTLAILLSFVMILNICCFKLYDINAFNNEEVITPYAYETYEIEEYYEIDSNNGGVDITLYMKRNLSTNVDYLLRATVENAFKSVSVYDVYGDVTTSPDAGTAVTNGYVIVTFSYTNWLYVWTKSTIIYI